MSAHILRLLQLLSLLAVILMIVMIFGLGHTSLATSTLSLHPPWDKCLHATVYGVMGALMLFSGALRHGLIVWLLMLCVGAFDEWHQISIPSRQTSADDLLADALGVALGIWVAGRVRRLIRVEA